MPFTPRLRAAIAALAFVSLISASMPAIAQTQQQKNILIAAAILTVANKWCKNLVVDLTAIGKVVVKVIGNIEKEPFKTLYVNEINETQSTFADAGADTACNTVYQTYGPSSQFGSTFIVKR